ncbi:CRISPR-associated protein Cas4 [Woodsholea maritima]|uniref:CRISPR-associated protein Cas4 n=1 Tax=Woodsholea maritima TaxID=240237 RepID=UPI0003AB0274|nr:CRISPR-associated protein Cas4 [Woodsholea maritima]
MIEPQPFDRTLEGSDTRLIPLSALQHSVYCLRQSFLIHNEQLWADNYLTAAGDILHKTSDRGARRTRAGVKHIHALPVGSFSLGLYGVCDLVEFTPKALNGVLFFPVEIKRGKPKTHRADEVQLCAQALCLEEMTKTQIPEGALFYGLTRRRVVVPFDNVLRTLTLDIIHKTRAVLCLHTAPAPTPHKSRCRACSLISLCRPDAMRGPAASQWISQQLDKLAQNTNDLDEDPRS